MNGSAIGYIRVSTDRQATEGISLELQTAKINAMALVKGYEVAEIIMDDESGKSLSRDGIQKVLQLVRSKKVDCVIIAKLDRLTRNLRDLLMILDVFKRSGVALISLNESIDTSTPIGRMMVNMLGVFNEFERENIGQRVKECLGHKKSKGGCVGQVPYGYESYLIVSDGATKPVKMLRRNESEQIIISQMKRLRTSGLSVQKICETLNSEGLVTRKGTPWTQQNMQIILKAPVVMALAA